MSAVQSELALRNRAFLQACRADVADFRLTPRAEPTAFARCFGVFGLHLIGETGVLDAARDALVAKLLRDVRAARTAAGGALKEKGYRQLLCFTLSALAILHALKEYPLADLIEEQLPLSIATELSTVGAPQGRGQSGNQAMFLAIFLLHAQHYLGRDMGAELASWVGLHRNWMNQFGFWGSNAGPTHLHFQNGYHQYEILEYLGADNPRKAAAMHAVASLADPKGHFAPYPGGGGCFDYDASFVLTPQGQAPDEPEFRCLLRRTRNTIASEQQHDGGFCESQHVRPRLKSLPSYVERLYSAGNVAVLRERLFYALTLQRFKHDRIRTHWSSYPRMWSESNLWDSWFRMLTLARIECALEPERKRNWGFIDYPGIGWHPSLRER